jgi:hypothetical protein
MPDADHVRSMADNLEVEENYVVEKSDEKSEIIRGKLRDSSLELQTLARSHSVNAIAPLRSRGIERNSTAPNRAHVSHR